MIRIYKGQEIYKIKIYIYLSISIFISKEWMTPLPRLDVKNVKIKENSKKISGKVLRTLNNNLFGPQKVGFIHWSISVEFLRGPNIFERFKKYVWSQRYS